MGTGILAILAAPSLLLAAGSAPPSFSDAWYRENVLGEMAAASEIYQRIYEDLRSPSPTAGRPATPLDLRRKAALRAGMCFERLGDGARAREAYAWLLKGGPSDDPMVRTARVRSLGLAPPALPAGSVPSGPVTDPPAPMASEGAQALDRFRLQVERREALDGELRSEIRRLAERVREEFRLRRRMDALGIDLRFDGSMEGARGVMDDFERSLDPSDRESLRRELAERYYLRGLQALREKNPAIAVEDLRKAIGFGSEGGYRDAADLIRRAREFLQPMEGLAQLAAQRIRERRGERELEVLQSMRSSLAAGRRDPPAEGTKGILAALEGLRAEEEWAPARIARLVEARAMAREADERTLLISLSGGAQPPLAGESVRRFEDLRSRGRLAADELLSDLEQLTDLAWASTERRRVILEEPSDGIGARWGASDVRRLIGEELERLLVRGEDQRRLQPQNLEGWRREFLNLQILIQWFPESDGDQRYRKLVQEYLGR